jgi:nitrogen PTS system EIIA component
MKLNDFLVEKAVIADLQSPDKESVVEDLISGLVTAGVIKPSFKAKVLRAVLEREKVGSTGIGGGIAVPHAKLDGIEGCVGTFGLSRPGIAFESLDGEPAHLFFLLISPARDSGVHVQALMTISRVLKAGHTAKFLLQAKSKAEIVATLKEADENV